MIPHPFGQIDEPTLRRLCNERCPESQTVEFKRELPKPDDKGRHELLKDVCALANADGGDLLYGVADEQGCAKDIAPITDFGADAAKRRLAQIIEAGVEPRLVGLQMRDISLADGGYVLIVRVPPSFNGPHRFSINGISRFVMRSGTHTVELSYEQLRIAFDRTATLAERARRFRDERLAAIIAGRTWRAMHPGPLCILHIVPITAHSGRHTVDIAALYDDYVRFRFDGWGGTTRSTNLDGLIVYPSGGGDLLAYTQLFRTGSIEFVRYAGPLARPESLSIPSRTISEVLRNAVHQLIAASCSLGFVGPAIIGAALLFTKAFKFAVGSSAFDATDAYADRDHLVLPETWIDNIEQATDVDAVARPLLDVLWQAFDQQRCTLYDNTGKWAPDR